MTRAIVALLAALTLSATAGAATKPTLYRALLDRPTAVQLHGITLLSFRPVASVDVEAFNAELPPSDAGITATGGVFAVTGLGTVAFWMIDSAGDADALVGSALEVANENSAPGFSVMHLPPPNGAFAFPDGTGWGFYGRVAVFVTASDGDPATAAQLLAFAVAHAKAAEAAA